jgi:hypothetical protein
VIDLDHNGAAATIGRLLDLGVVADVLADPGRFRYCEPEDAEHLTRVVADSQGWRPAVVVVDSIGELLPLLRLSSNSPDDYTTANTRALQPFAHAGAAVIAIDHLAKNPESRTQGASGTAAKRRAIGGTSLRVTVKEPFAPGQGGAAYVTISKDRHGGLRAHCPPGREPAAGTFQLIPEYERLRWVIWSPQPADTVAASGVRDEDLAELDALDPPPRSQRDVQDRLRWGGSRALATLRAWRQLHPDDAPRSGSAPQEQEQHTAPRSAAYVSGSKEHLSNNEVTGSEADEVIVLGELRDWRSVGIEAVTRRLIETYGLTRKTAMEAATVAYTAVRKFHEPNEMYARVIKQIPADCGHPLVNVTTNTGRCALCIVTSLTKESR